MKKLLELEKLKITCTFDKNCIPTYYIVNSQNKIVDNNNGLGYAKRQKAIKQLQELEKNLIKQKERELIILNNKMQKFFNQHIELIRNCRKKEATGDFSLDNFKKELEKHHIIIPYKIKYLFYYFKNGPIHFNKKNLNNNLLIFDVSKGVFKPSVVKKKKEKHLSLNQAFKRFVKKFNYEQKLLKTE